MDVSFDSVALVSAVAVVAPLALTLTAIRLPAIVLEIVLGIVIGPHVLGWATADEPVTVLSRLGLAFLLLLAGLEIDFARLRRRLLRLTSTGFAVSFALALAVGYGLRLGDLVKSPLLIAIILSATGLGVILPILKDAGETDTAFGQVIVAGASIAEVTPILMLSLFFSGESGGVGAKLALLVAFLVFVTAVGVTILGLQRSMRISEALVRLQDTTAEIRVRGAFLLLALFVVLASRFGLEAILGAFLAGATLKLVDRDEMMTHAFSTRSSRRPASASSCRSSSSRRVSASTSRACSTAAQRLPACRSSLPRSSSPAACRRCSTARSRNAAASSQPAACSRRPPSASPSSR